MSIEDQTTMPEDREGQQKAATGDHITSAATKNYKSDHVGKLLRRAKGATLPELKEATAWQPHSIRAFLSGLRKKGEGLTKEQRKSGETAYRLVGKSAADQTASA
jgi:hypothetical protein